eukprot:15364932-Ditylum_brightwellii.AAC.1
MENNAQVDINTGDNNGIDSNASSVYNDEVDSLSDDLSRIEENNELTYDDFDDFVTSNEDPDFVTDDEDFDVIKIPTINAADSYGSISGAIPSSLLVEKISSYGFATVAQHVRSRFTLSSIATSTDQWYIAYCYAMLTTLAVNHSDTCIVLN